MPLSNRATHYLATLQREHDWQTTAKATQHYLEQQNLDPEGAFFIFQQQYSGYELTIKDAPTSSFLATLFSKQQVRRNTPLELEIAGNRTLEICGEHKTAPFDFYLSDQGEICTFEEEEPNILYHSFDQLVEDYALRNELADWFNTPYYKVQNLEELDTFLSTNFERLVDSSDAYATWWRKDNLMVNKGIWLHEPLPYVVVYSRHKTAGEYLIYQLTAKGMIA